MRAMHRSGSSLAAAFVLVFSTLTFYRVASAQVNTEALRAKVRAEGVSGTVQASFAGSLGNTEGMQAGGAGGVGFATGHHLAFVWASGDYSRFNTVTQVSKTFAHARYDYELAHWMWGEAFAQVQSDQFQRLKLRNLFGIGPRFSVYQGDEGSVFAGAAIMWEREKIDVAPGEPDDPDSRLFRASSYLALSYKLDDRVTASATGYYQPRVDRWSDFRVLAEGLVTFKITKHFSAGVTVTFRYDNAPPSTVKPADGEMKNTLAVIF